ncbi:MAG: hypothetical protein ACFE0I_14200 [Elainellaceae cyanobacterium]
MESGSSSSQTDKPHERSHTTLSNIIGTVVALVTLVIPILSIAYFSSSAEIWQPPTYQFLKQRD